MSKGSLQHWFDASPAWKCPGMDLAKEAVEHLSPNQIPVLTMDQPHSVIGKEIQWLWPDLFGKNMSYYGWGEGGLRVEIAGRVVEWLHHVVLQNLLWNHLARTRHAHQMTDTALHGLQLRAFLSYVQFEPTVSSKKWQTHNYGTEQPQFKKLDLISSSVSFGLCIQFAVVTSTPCMQCPTILMSWRVALDHMNYSIHIREMSNIELTQLLLPWLILLSRKQNRGKSVATIVDYLP